MKILTVALLVLAALTAAQPATAAAPPEKWAYAVKTDSMTDATRTVARLRSPTKLNLRFPYQGGTVGTLIVDHRGNEGVAVLFHVSRGQLVKDEGLIFRFEDGPPISFLTAAASDGSSDRLWIVGNGTIEPFNGSAQNVQAVTLEQLLGMIASAKRLRVKATLYDAGSPTFEFAPAGLTFEQPTPKPASEAGKQVARPAG